MFEISLLVIFFAIYKNDTSSLNINDFVMKYSVLALALIRLIPSFAKLSAHFSWALYNLNSVQYIERDLRKKLPKKNNKISKKDSIRTMRIQGVRLDYINKDNSKLSRKFNNLSINLKKNNIYGIVGESGSGKSTLGRCLVRLLVPDKGIIKVGGQDISQISGDSLRQHRRRIQMVFQDPYILSITR